MPINKNPRTIRKRDIGGELENRVGGGTPVGRATGGGRTTRTGTPRTSTNTSAPSRRTSPGQRVRTKNYDAGMYMPGENGLTKKQQRKGTQASSVANSYTTGNSMLSPKKARTILKQEKISSKRRTARGN